MINTKSNKGQSLVEYMLLMGVMAAIAASLYKSSLIQNLISKDGSFITQMKLQMEWEYRYALPMPKGTTTIPPNDNEMKHPSYMATDTRFFGPAEPYPK